MKDHLLRSSITDFIDHDVATVPKSIQLSVVSQDIRSPGRDADGKTGTFAPPPTQRLRAEFTLLFGLERRSSRHPLRLVAYREIRSRAALAPKKPYHGCRNSRIS